MNKFLRAIKKAKLQRGDTLVEVMLSIAIIAAAIGGGYKLAHHGLQTGIDASQRSEAVSVASKQIERIRDAELHDSGLLNLFVNPPLSGGSSTDYCILDSTGSTPTIQAATDDQCKDYNSQQFALSDHYDDGTRIFTITATWPHNINTPNNVTLYYKLPPAYNSFELRVTPSTQSANKGATVTYNVTSKVNGSFNKDVSLSLQGLPASYSYSFNNSPIPHGAGSSSLSITIPNNASPGTLNFSVVGTASDGTTKNANAQLVVQAPSSNPSLNFTANPLSVNEGQSSQLSWSQTPGSFTFDKCTGTGGMWGSSPGTDVAIGQNGGTNSAGTGNLSTSTTYALTCSNSTNGYSSTQQVTVSVTPKPQPDFAVVASPTTITVKAGKSGTVVVGTTISNGFNAGINFSIPALPKKVTATFSPTSVSAPGQGTSTLTLKTTSGSNKGTYGITITATGGGIIHSVDITLVINNGGGGGGTCTDTSANNYGQPLPCTYNDNLCHDPAATNNGGPAPCQYPPPPSCWDTQTCPVECRIFDPSADVWVLWVPDYSLGYYIHTGNVCDNGDGSSSSSNSNSSSDNSSSSSNNTSSSDSTTSSGGGGCFVAGTMVLTPDGQKPIEKVKTGDVIETYDTRSGRMVASPVVETFTHYDKDTVVLKMAGGGTVTTTSVHRFWTNFGWLEVGKFVPNKTYVMTKEGFWEKVVSATPGAKATVYNLHVYNDDHDYFAGGYLVHNVKVDG